MAELFILERLRTKSLYNKLPARGYTTHIWPARFPDAETVIGYGNKLAPYITKQLTADINRRSTNRPQTVLRL